MTASYLQDKRTNYWTLRWDTSHLTAGPMQRFRRLCAILVLIRRWQLLFAHDGAVDLAIAYHQRGDVLMLERLKAADLSAMRFRGPYCSGCTVSP